MLKILFTIAVCGSYTDTIALLALLTVFVLLIEQQWFNVPEYLSILQIVLGYALATILRRINSIGKWSFTSVIVSNEISSSTDRLFTAVIIYVAILGYGREISNGFPIGIFSSIIIVFTVLCVADIFIRMDVLQSIRWHSKLKPAAENYDYMSKATLTSLPPTQSSSAAVVVIDPFNDEFLTAPISPSSKPTNRQNVINYSSMHGLRVAVISVLCIALPDIVIECKQLDNKWLVVTMPFVLFTTIYGISWVITELMSASSYHQKKSSTYIQM